MTNFTAEEIALLPEDEQIELLALLEQELKECVSPKLEAFRDPIIGGSCDSKYRIRGARGGRGAGAKSHSLVSLIVQRANAESIDVACFREIQGSIDESVKKLIEEKISFLGYKDWIIKQASIEGPLINGKRSHFIFKGLKDLRASTNVKGMEGYDIYFLEEAATISMASLNLLMPTLMRTPGSQLWFAYNPELEDDPITVKIWDRQRDDALLIDLKPGKEDNPWWNEGLQKEMEEDFKADPVEADHIWNGNPRIMSEFAILSTIEVQAAMDRNLPILRDNTPLVVGADIARGGLDRTTIFVRKGMKTINHKVLTSQDGVIIANEMYAMGNYNPTTIYNIDATGVGAGVVDVLRRIHGQKHVHEIHFGALPIEKEKYVMLADELWFNFKELINDIDIPDIPELKSELTSRLYSYDKRGRRTIESKDKYKERRGKSPDLADGILLCYYNDINIQNTMTPQERAQMRNRRRG